MTREQLLNVLTSAYELLNGSYNDAYVSGLLGPDARMQLRGAMYEITSVQQAVKRDGQLEKLVESAEK